MIRKPWVYNGREHWTTGDLLNTIEEIETVEEAEEFFDAYSEVCDVAEEMLGYYAHLIGVRQGKEFKEDILDLFMVDDRPTFIENNFGHAANGVPPSSCGLKIMQTSDKKAA